MGMPRIRLVILMEVTGPFCSRRVEIRLMNCPSLYCENRHYFTNSNGFVNGIMSVSSMRWDSSVLISQNDFTEFVSLGNRLAKIKSETGVDGFEPRGEQSQVDLHAVMELMAARSL